MYGHLLQDLKVIEIVAILTTKSQYLLYQFRQTNLKRTIIIDKQQRYNNKYQSVNKTFNIATDNSIS